MFETIQRNTERQINETTTRITSLESTIAESEAEKRAAIHEKLRLQQSLTQAAFRLLSASDKTDKESIIPYFSQFLPDEYTAGQQANIISQLEQLSSLTYITNEAILVVEDDTHQTLPRLIKSKDLTLSSANGTLSLNTLPVTQVDMCIGKQEIKEYLSTLQQRTISLPSVYQLAQVVCNSEYGQELWENFPSEMKAFSTQAGIHDLVRIANGYVDDYDPAVDNLESIRSLLACHSGLPFGASEGEVDNAIDVLARELLGDISESFQLSKQSQLQALYIIERRSRGYEW